MNCPGRAAGSRSVTGSSTRVTESRFSATRDRTRWDTGAIASATGAGSGAGAAAGVLSTVGRMIGTGVFGVDRAGAPGPQPVQRPHLLGDVDSGGAPGDTAPAPHTAGTAELIVPGAQFVGEPVPVPGRAGLPHHPAVNVGEVELEAGRPLHPPFGVGAGQIGGVGHAGAETGGAHHGAVAAGQA